MVTSLKNNQSSFKFEGLFWNTQWTDDSCYANKEQVFTIGIEKENPLEKTDKNKNIWSDMSDLKNSYFLELDLLEIDIFQL